MQIKYPLGPYNKVDAYHLVDSFLDQLQVEHKGKITDASKTWNENKDTMDFKFNAQGFDISGDIKINEDNLVLNGKLPLVARLVSGKIERIINEKLDELFVK
jgi:hypothetical protein